MECNAWTWCADADTCLDEHLRRIPYRGCQLKTETQQPAGLPSDEYVRKFRPSTLASGYVKRASQLPRPPRAHLRHALEQGHGAQRQSLQRGQTSVSNVCSCNGRVGPHMQMLFDSDRYFSRTCVAARVVFSRAASVRAQCLPPHQVGELTLYLSSFAAGMR